MSRLQSKELLRCPKSLEQCPLAFSDDLAELLVVMIVFVWCPMGLLVLGPVNSIRILLYPNLLQLLTSVRL